MPAVAFILVVGCAVVPIRTEGAAAAQTPVADAKRPDHGLVLTLGDVLFTSGRADLKPAAMGSLNKLVTFLAKYPGHSVAIHGYTDSVGSEEYNQVPSAVQFARRWMRIPKATSWVRMLPSPARAL